MMIESHMRVEFVRTYKRGWKEHPAIPGGLHKKENSSRKWRSHQ